jgi:hypothetical protein
MNPLNNYPQVRAILYLIQWVVNGVIAVLSAAFGFVYGLPDDWPMWFLGVLAVAPVLWTYLGLTAQQNTPALLRAPKYHDHDGEEVYEVTEHDPSLYGQTPPMNQPGSDEDGWGGDAPPRF